MKRVNSLKLCVRNNFWGLLVLAVAVFGIFASGVQSAPGGMVVVCDLWPPYQMVDREGRLEGFSVTVVTEVLQRMNASVDSLRHYPWKRAMAMVRVGEADALFSGNKTPARQEFARYPAEPLVSSLWVCWTRKADRLDIVQLSDLANKRVGVVSGYSYTEEFWNFINKYSRVEQVHNDESNFRKLNRGRLDVIVAELGNGQHIVNTLGFKAIRPHRQYVVKQDGLYVLFSRKTVSAEVAQRFSRELAGFKREQWYFDLKKKYLMPAH